ncbi:MAG: hypothetical protein ACK56F_11820, partial [bacterium]
MGAATGRHHLRDARGPTRLVGRTAAPAGLAVEVLVEVHQPLKRRIRRELLVHRKRRPHAALIGKEEPRGAPRNLVGGIE